MYPRQTLNPDPPDSTSRVLGWQMCITFPFYVVLGIEPMALWVLVRYGTHGLMCVSWVRNPWPRVCVSEAFYQLSSGSSPSLLVFSWDLELVAFLPLLLKD